MSKLEYLVGTPIYTIVSNHESKAWKLVELDLALQEVYTRGKPAVVFVHRRGNEPNKSLRGATFTP